MDIQREKWDHLAKDEMDLLYSAIETVERCLNEYPNGCGDDDDYNGVEGWEEWFGFTKHKQSIDMEYCPDGYGMQATFDNYRVLYYDNGKEHECEVHWH